MFFCHSPKEHICVSICSPVNNSTSNCICLTNCCHQPSLSNLPTENCEKCKKRLTYQITSNKSVSPTQSNGKIHKVTKPLRNRTPSMYKFYSKSNPYLKMKRNNSNENFIFRNQNNLNDVTESYINNSNKNFENYNSNNNLKRNNSNEFSYVRKDNKDVTNNIINIKKNNFMNKIKCFSNRLDKENDNKGKNIEPSMNDESNNTYNIGSYNNKDIDFNENCHNPNENASKIKTKNMGLNIDKINKIKLNYNKKNRFLEKMKKINEKEKKLVDLKMNNLSNIISGNNIYNKIGNKLTNLKKEKPDYDYIFSDKNKYVNENIDPNKNENVDKSNYHGAKKYINFKERNWFNKNCKKKSYNDNSNLVNDEDNSLYYNYNYNNKNYNESFDENNQKKNTSVRIFYGKNNINENISTIENKNDYIINNENKNWNDKLYLKNDNKNTNDSNKLFGSNNYKENKAFNNKINFNNRNRFGNIYYSEVQSNSQNINNTQINPNKFNNNRNINRSLNHKYNKQYLEEAENENIINNKKYNNPKKIRKFDSCDNIKDMHGKKDFNFDIFNRNNKINNIEQDKINNNLDDKNENRDNNYQDKENSRNYRENKENSIYIKNQYIQKSDRNNKDMNSQYDNHDDLNKKRQNIKNNNSVDNIFNPNNKYIGKFNNNYNSECPINIKKNHYLNYKYDIIRKDNIKNKYINSSCDYSDDIMNHLNFNYDDYIGIYNDDISDYDNLQGNHDSNTNKNNYYLDYNKKINNKKQHHNNDINYDVNKYNNNSNNNNNYFTNNDPQYNDINNLIRYTDKSYKNKKFINMKNNEKENKNENKNEDKYVEEESLDIYNRSFSDYIYNTDKKRKDRYDNNYYEEIIHTKRYKEYMITSPYKNLHKNKSVEIKRNYFSYPNKLNIRNNSEYHRRVCLYKNIHDNDTIYKKLNFQYGSSDDNSNYNSNNKRYYDKQDFNINNYSKENAYDKVNICNNYNYDNYKRRSRHKNLMCDENRNYSEENIRINKMKDSDNVNKNTNISSNCYENYIKNHKGNNKLRDIINESYDFSNKNTQKNNDNNEKDNIQSNKRFVKIKIFNENKEFMNKNDDKYNDNSNYINNKNSENIFDDKVDNRNNNIQQKNLKEDNEDINSKIISKKNMMFEKITFGDFKENDKDSKSLNEKEKEMKIKELEEEIKKLKSNYIIMENKYNTIIKENESFKRISTRSTQIENELKECKFNLNSFKRKNGINEEKIKKLENINQELISEIKLYNGRESKDDSLKREIIKLKEQIKKLERENQNLIFNNTDKKTKFDALLSKHNELLVKYNNLHLNKNADKIDRGNPVMSVKKDELYDNHLVLTVKKLYGKLNQDIDQMNLNKNSMSMELNSTGKKYEKMEKNCKILEDENERLKIILNKTKNSNLSHEYDYMPNTNDSNNELILSYKKIIDELNNEISSLKEIIEKNKKEVKELKDKIGNKSKSKNNSLYDDEIVIVRKETTVSKSYNIGDESSKNAEINNNFSVKKNFDLSEGDIIKYHEIIQDLTNLVLVYENFFFNKEVKPKNNSELQCVLIVEYINRKIRKIKLNTLINLIIYKNTLPKKSSERNSGLRRNSNDSRIKTNYKYLNRNKMGNYNERNFSRNIQEDE